MEDFIFIPQAYLQTSNWGGIEIQLSDDGEAVKARDNYGQPNMEVSDWLEITYDEDSRPIFTFQDEVYFLDDFMVTDYA